MDKSQVEVCENQVETDTLKTVSLYMIYCTYLIHLVYSYSILVLSVLIRETCPCDALTSWNGFWANPGLEALVPGGHVWEFPWWRWPHQKSQTFRACWRSWPVPWIVLTFSADIGKTFFVELGVEKQSICSYHMQPVLALQSENLKRGKKLTAGDTFGASFTQARRAANE